MEQSIRFLIVSFGLALAFVSASTVRAQIDVGDYTVSGSAEVDGLPRTFSGDKTRFEQYRDVPESVVVPQLDLSIQSKKNDYFLEFNGGQVGREDQNYRLRYGRYGLFNIELEWDQIPAAFNIDNARTPYNMNGGTYTLGSRPTSDNPITFANWINDPNNTSPINLDLLNKIGKISINYTPTPGWTFTGKYWQQNTDGKRAIAFPFGSGSSSNIAELAEPIDYQTHNIELGGEYAGKGWSLGLRYNGSIFHNSISTLVFDNPAAIGPGCIDAAAVNYTTGRGPCRGRVDLYPSNQAHTFSMVGTASLPLKTQFLGTVSYGWRLQNDSFLPFTINSAIANPTLSRNSLDGDVRPTMVNLTLVNNFINNLNLKAYYRFYDLDSKTNSVSTPATVRNDQSTGTSDWTQVGPYQYSKNTAGFQTSYNFTNWLTGKFNVNWDRLHRDIPQIPSGNEALNSNETKIGPTFDIKPVSWLLLRASYQHSWRSDPGYTPEDGREAYFLAARNQQKVSLFTDISPWDTLSFHAGFDFTGDNYPEGAFGVESARGYSPSVGFLYSPVDWLKFFGDYNFDRTRWNQNYNATIRSHGIDRVNTFSLGSDMDLIKNLLGLHMQYGFSQGFSQIVNNNNNRWPDNSNTWQELLTRLEYKVHKNVALQVGYYFNKFHSKDYGVDIMRLWMGNFDTNTGILRSVFLGDQFKGSYTAHVAILGLKLNF
jgi:MtrB/PioB family decaheme-associated outer membrane protein